MAQQERRKDWGGAAGLMFNLPYYGLNKEQRLKRVCHEHLDKCHSCRSEWKDLWKTIPENKITDTLAALIQRNHK